MTRKRKEELDPKLIPTELVVSVIKEKYGFEVIDPPYLMDGGVESAVWLVNTDKGRWYAKVYGVHEGDIERIQDEIELYGFLLSKNVNVPEVVNSLSDDKVETLSIPQAEYLMILMKYEDLKEASPSTVSREEVIKVGKAIASLHKTALDYREKNKLDTKGISAAKIPEDAYETFSKSVNASEYAPEELEDIKQLIANMITFLKENPIPDDLTKSVLHGDMAFEHAQFLPNGEVYFFDFGDRWYGPVIQDLAVMVENLYQPEDISFERFEQLKDWLLEGYLSVNNLTSEELEFIKPLVVMRNLIASNYLNEISLNTAKKFDDQGVRRRFNLAKYLLSTHQRAFLIDA